MTLFLPSWGPWWCLHVLVAAPWGTLSVCACLSSGHPLVTCVHLEPVLLLQHFLPSTQRCCFGARTASALLFVCKPASEKDWFLFINFKMVFQNKQIKHWETDLIKWSFCLCNQSEITKRVISLSYKMQILGERGLVGTFFINLLIKRKRAKFNQWVIYQCKGNHLGYQSRVL